ncbi:MurR/RpiR family transcriptional regulator [Flexilinea flocculi]|jgi:RpiR family carbohydrate utilization transcriptional regulator|uniref:Transcriptional regulator, RpiR family n=1 Tax=Flexilinea flocculi TaxID=1678840 RepID=A0A0K8PB65_9CHLR|nr:MurR/RpiR family transcriptional regulator [Flexilinea flocculi]NMB94635.1 MurR/RpiR family transcriptional regulator [Flexilinea flocculi]GAP39886.1 transcriptional regulator, RpiR family [Flexilinea flocculi]
MGIIQSKSVIETIKDNYDQIFSSEKKIADFILASPELAVNANVSELANYSNVSDATVIRFCKHIGYQGYYQLRINLSRDLGRKQSRFIESTNGEADTVDNLFKMIAADMMRIGQNIDQSTMVNCANLIKKCNHAHIIAVGNTSPFAQYMGFRLGRLGIKCSYGIVAEYFMNHINLAEKGDIVIAISQSGCSKQVVQAMELAKEKSLKQIAITAYKYSPVSSLADYLLLSDVGERTVYSSKNYSHLYEAAVIDALLYFVTNEETINANDADKPEIIFSEYKL